MIFANCGEKMASIRKGMCLMHRDAAARIGETSTDSSSSSPKLSRIGGPYFVFKRLVHLISSPIELLVLERIRSSISGICPQKSLRPFERSRGKRQQQHKRLFHLFVFFAVGIVLGSTTFLSENVSNSISLKGPALSFQDANIAEEGNPLINEVSLLEISEPAVGGEKQEEEVASEIKSGTIEPPEISPSIPFSDAVSRKLLIIVTATYPRPFQAYYLNRLAHTLRNVPSPLLWLVVEMYWPSPETAKILRDSGVMYRNMVSYAKTKPSNRIVHQRNLALTHIENHQLDGIVYFADDDGVYSPELFERMREIRRFGVWPVATLSKNKARATLDGPTCNSRRVTGWLPGDRRMRKQRFRASILGFAFNSTMIWDRKRWPWLTLDPLRMREAVFRGVQETSYFIEQLVENESQMEGLSGNLSEIMVWNQYLEAPKLIYPEGWSVPKNLEVVEPLTLHPT